MPNTTPVVDAEDFSNNLRAEFEKTPNATRFTPEQLEVLYGMGYAHAQQEQWEKAIAVFAFLSQYGPTRQHYLAGLALCMHKLHRFDDAINVYSLMLVLFPDKLEPALRIAECELALGDSAAAQQSLEKLLIATSKEDPLHIRARTLNAHLASKAVQI